jgi:hypothetical protein
MSQKKKKSMKVVILNMLWLISLALSLLVSENTMITIPLGEGRVDVTIKVRPLEKLQQTQHKPIQPRK